MTGYRISQAAEMAGFTPSALRFYEGEGLLPSPARSASGYRSYDDAAISRLRFVHRARQLGLGLEAIRDLVTVWDAGACAPVQHGFARRIATHRKEVAARLGELSALHEELLTAERTITAADSSSACGPGCACLAAPDAMPAPARGGVDVALSPMPPALPAQDTIAVACTLDGPTMAGRMRDWAAVACSAVARESTASGVRLAFFATPELAARISELAALEQTCCPFLTFTVTFTPGRIVLDVAAPDGAADLVSALLAGAA